MALLASAIAIAGETPRAAAITGDLSRLGCIRDDDYPLYTCIESRGARGIGLPTEIAQSPDGASIYVGGRSLATFTRDTSTGRLTFLGCHGRPLSTGNVVDGCTLVPITAADPFVRDVAAASDGSHVYAIVGNSIAVFSRGPNGVLAYDSCVGGSTSCVTPTGADEITAFYQRLALSADGASLYAVSAIQFPNGAQYGTLDTFRRDPATGRLTYVSCLTSRAVQTACTRAPSLAYPLTVDVSADGRAVYTGSGPNIVNVFSRDTAGGIGFIGCIAGEGTDKPGTTAACTQRTSGLVDPESVVVSRDSRNVYVLGNSSDTVSVFVRNTTDSTLTFTGCLRGSHRSGAGCISAPGLNGPQGLAVSFDGRSLYVTGREDHALDTFVRNPADGSFRFRSCITDVAAGACSGADGLRSAWGVVSSPDSRDVYVTGLNDHAIALFRREVANAGRLGEVTPTTLAFAAQPVGTASASQSVVLKNIGTGPLQGLDATIEGANANEFSRVNGCRGALLDPGLSCTIDVTFKPLTAGSKTATLLVTDDGPGSPHEVTLTGTATQPDGILPPPDTTIDAGPKAKTRKTTAAFAFSSSTPGSTFECSLDGGDFTPCTSPLVVGSLERGPHVFSVRATSPAGAFDQTPAELSFQIKKKRRR